MHSSRSAQYLPDTSKKQQSVKQTANQSNNQGRTIPHSFSAPTMSNYQPPDNIERVEMVDLRNEFGYMDAIEALHRRHLEEKQLVAGIKQKI